MSGRIEHKHAPQTLDGILSPLVDRFPIKVWSYLTTIFGDLSGESDFEIPGTVLSQLSDRIGIRPEAMRVALHRLRKDNWIAARKVGRVSYYRLSPERQKETKAASERIYSVQGTTPPHLKIVLFDPETDQKIPGSPHYLEVGKGIAFASGRLAAAHKNALVVETTPAALPQWMKVKSLPNGWENDCRDFRDYARVIGEFLSQSRDMTPLDRATLRLILVHNWRRLILRLPQSAENIQSPDWVGHECRALTLSILDRLPRSELAGLVTELRHPIREPEK